MDANHHTTAEQPPSRYLDADPPSPTTKRVTWTDSGEPHATSVTRRKALFCETPRGLVLQHVRTSVVSQRGDTGVEIDPDAIVDDLPEWLQTKLAGRLVDEAAPVALTDGGQPVDDELENLGVDPVLFEAVATAHQALEKVTAAEADMTDLHAATEAMDDRLDELERRADETPHGGADA